MELGDSPEEHRIMYSVLMSHIRPFQGLGFSAKSLLSSGAFSATPFQRKGALALCQAALVT